MSNIRYSKHNCTSADTRITRVETTSDCITSRGGLALFSRYVDAIGFTLPVKRLFGSMRKSRKGLPVPTLFKQMLCYLFDGTSRHLTYFDELRTDAGYAAAIETPTCEMASSHQIKRFLAAFSFVRIWKFRRLLQQLFLWRLCREKPDVVVLGVDTMVMDNSEADVRHGVEPTYKKGIKGFQPFHITWGRLIIDAVFRKGSKHSNDGDTAIKALRHLITRIRCRYRDVPIIVRMDAGFFDQKIMAELEALEVGYLIGGKLYEDIRERVDSAPEACWKRFGRRDADIWAFQALVDRRKSWDVSRHAIFMRRTLENGQGVLGFAQTESVIYTNITTDDPIGRALIRAGRQDILDAGALIRLYHDRGCDELVHRALKDFAPEELPCKRFNANAAVYFMRLIAFFLMETFKEDVCDGVIEITSYATRIRRRLIDMAAKIVRTGGQVILKASETAYRSLRLDLLWQRANDPPRLSLS